MKVQLTAITQNLETPMASPEESMIFTARLSSDQRVTNHEKLLNYCLEHGHWSVFESQSLTYKIECPLFVATQLLRHRSCTFQMLSQRYSEINVSQMPELECRYKADGGNRQGSGEPDAALTEMLKCYVADSFDNYDKLIEAGASPETARQVLPQATPTTLYVTGTVRSIIHLLMQRLTPHAQKEIREVAEAMLALFTQRYPICAKHIRENV
jgi:thymidylate synthase (FAD)